jgi:hypothetical protein
MSAASLDWPHGRPGRVGPESEGKMLSKRTTLLVAALTLAASGAGASVAAATPGPTPVNGLTGACNMTNTHAAFGMFTIAGSHANTHGFDEGMITAILNTNGGTIPDNCQG